ELLRRPQAIGLSDLSRVTSGLAQLAGLVANRARIVRSTSLKSSLVPSGAVFMAMALGGGCPGIGASGTSFRRSPCSTIPRSLAFATLSPMSGGLADMKQRAMVFAIDV